MPLTPQFVMNLESRMKLITERGYAGLSQKLWWSKVARLHPSESKRDIIAWLISTATLTDQGDGGNVNYDEIEAKYTEVTNRQRGSGLRISVNELTDLDGNGIQAASQWSSDQGQLFAYDPQYLIAKLMKAGETTVGYDAKNYFATDHPVNPVDSTGGTYANLMTSSASGLYPGALPIGTATAQDGLTNLGKLYAYMASVPQPSGLIPRLLKPVDIFSPPALMPKFAAILDSKFIAATAVAATATLAAAGGTMDVTGIQSMLGMAKPIQCDELASTFGGSDTDYYVSFAPMGVEDSQLGALLYVERQAFSILYHGNVDQADLDRKDVLEWKSKGRNAAAPGHPYLLVKCKAN